MSDQPDAPLKLNDCPACGVPVTAGYPRCPKCHAAMPGAPKTAAPAAAEQASGGTSVVDEGTGSGMWIAIAAGFAVAGLIVFFMAHGGSDHHEKPAPSGVAKGAVADPVVVPGPGAGADDESDRGAVSAAQQAKVSARNTALTLVRNSLEGKRLWSTVELHGDVLVIHSAFCKDDGVVASVTEAGKELLAGGITGVRCHERFGALVFELPLKASRGPATAAGASGDE